VTLSAAPSSSAQQLAFDCAVISTPSVNNTTPTESFYDNTDTTRLAYTGDWYTSSAPGIPNASVSHEWHETNKSSAVSMQIGQGAVGVSLWGMANWGNWIYSVSLDGSTSTHNGSTFWQVPDALLFYQGGLDPTANHTISLSNVSPTMNLALNSIRVYNIDTVHPSSSTTPNASSTSTPSKHSTVNVGAIAGSIVGVAVLVLVGGFLWWRFRRSRASKNQDMTQAEGYTYKSPHTPHFPSKPGYAEAPPSAVFRSPSTTLGSQTQIGGATTTDLSGTRPPEGKRRLVTSPPAVSPTSTSPAATSPTVTLLTTTLPPAALAPSDVDRLIELIAHRIDPARRRDESAAPPEYRG